VLLAGADLVPSIGATQESVEIAWSRARPAGHRPPERRAHDRFV